MDIVGIGTEIVECLRIGRMIEQHGELFLGRVYTQREISAARHADARQSTSPLFGPGKKPYSRPWVRPGGAV